MKRVDLGVGTMARVRFQTSPLVELSWLLRLGLSGERHPVVGSVVGPVRRALSRPDMALVRDLLPPGGRGPFPCVTATPVRGSTTLADELDRVAGRDADETAAELATTARPVPGRLQDLADDGRLGPALADRLLALWRILVPPELAAELERAGREEVAVRCGQIGTEGLDVTLGQLHPRVHWAGPGRLVLDKPLVGHGRLTDEPLVLVPAVLSGAEPLIAPEPGTVSIIYAVRRPTRADRESRAGRAPSRARLLGATRAQVLEALARGEASTTELGRRLEMPVSTVSSQLAVLHRAGFVTRRRDGRSVRYAVLPEAVSGWAPAGVD